MLQLASQSGIGFVADRSALFSETLGQTLAEAFRLITLDSARGRFTLCTFAQ
jgi:hypothetical protein